MPDAGPEVIITLKYNPNQPGAAGMLADTLADLSIALSKRGVSAVVMSPTPTHGDDEEEPPLAVQPASKPEPMAGPVKRVRDRTAERRAAREKAAAEAAAATETDPLLGGNGQAGAGDPFADDDDDEPPASQPEADVRTPKQCYEGALAILRQAFGRPGGAGAEEVKRLQKVYKISKFTDLPLDQAPGLWRDALVLAKQFDIDIPAVPT